MSENRAKQWLQYTAVICICLGAWGTGTALGWSTNITKALRNGKLNDLNMTEEELTWATSSMPLGAMVVCLPIGFISDAIGRKPTALITVFPFVLGWLLIMFSRHIAMIYAGRFLTGVAGGSFSIIAPLYATEIAETEIRGILGSLFHVFVAIGILYSAALSLTSMVVYHSLLLAVPIVSGVIFLFQSETPIYLIRKGKLDKLPEAYEKLRGKEYDPSGEVNATKEQIAKERSGFWKTMKTGPAKKATLICFLLMFYQQFSGITAIIFYLGEMKIFKENGEITIIGAHVIHLCVAIYTSWRMKTNSRKSMLLESFVVMTLDAAVVGMLFSLKDREVVGKDSFYWVDLFTQLFVFAYFIGFSFGLGPISWLAPFELFPPEVKVACGSAAAAFNWFLAFLFTKFYFSMVSAIKRDVIFYVILSALLLGSCIIVSIIPEIKNETLAEIQEQLEIIELDS